MVMSDNYKLNL